MTDDEYGALLLRPLAGEPAGQPRLDVGRAMREGRRLRRRRWWSGLTGFAAVTGTVVAGGVLLAPIGDSGPRPEPPDLPADPPVPTSCTGSRLPAKNYDVVSIGGGDNGGRWLAGTGSPTTLRNDRVLVWRDGALVADLPSPRPDYAPTDVNRAGVAVGPGWFYRDGRLHRLPGTGTVRGVAINDDGVIAGEVVQGGRARPARWASTKDKPELLDLPPNTRGDASIRDIDDEGYVAGVIDHRAYLWSPDGTVREIVPPIGGGRPSSPQGGANFIVAAMRNGWIYGDMDSAEGSFAYRYEPRSGTWQQLEGRGGAGFYGELEVSWAEWSRVRVNRTIITMPPDPASVAEKRRADAFQIGAVSDDARVIAGEAYPTASGVMAIKAVIWRCR